MVNPTRHFCDSRTKTKRVNRKQRPSQGESQMYIFEDSEAVIKMKKKRSKSYAETCIENSQSRYRLVV